MVPHRSPGAGRLIDGSSSASLIAHFSPDHELKLKISLSTNSAKHHLCIDHFHMLKRLYPRLPLWAISRGITRAC